MKAWYREIMLLLLVVMPLVQLYIVWPSIPDVIPVHYGLDGNADRFDSKRVLLWFIPVLPMLLYGVLTLVPRLDPKRRVNYGQSGYNMLRFATIMLVSVIFISYLFSLVGEWSFSKSIPLLLMAFFIVLGNYLPIIRPNYFMGIRTPWTLESERVWARTHRFSGRLWVAGGVAGILVYLLWPKMPFSLGMGMVALLVMTSVVYSYWAYQQDPAQSKDEHR